MQVNVQAISGDFHLKVGGLRFTHKVLKDNLPYAKKVKVYSSFPNTFAGLNVLAY